MKVIGVIIFKVNFEIKMLSIQNWKLTHGIEM